MDPSNIDVGQFVGGAFFIFFIGALTGLIIKKIRKVLQERRIQSRNQEIYDRDCLIRAVEEAVIRASAYSPGTAASLLQARALTKATGSVDSGLGSRDDKDSSPRPPSRPKKSSAFRRWTFNLLLLGVSVEILTYLPQIIQKYIIK